MKFNLKDILSKVAIGVAVGKVAMGGKHSKIFDRIEQGEEIANKASEIQDLVSQMFKKKNTQTLDKQ
jgi:hypothetical protein